jgi:hypothetical protein
VDSQLPRADGQDARYGRNGPWIDGQPTERPSSIFKRNFRAVPYWEDKLEPVFELAGMDVVVGGSTSSRKALAAF